MLHHEYWALPVNLTVAGLASLFGRFADAEAVWSFSPMIDLSIYRWVTRNLRRPHLDRQILLLLMITAMQFADELARRGCILGDYLSCTRTRWLIELAICAACAGGGGHTAEDLECNPDREEAGGAGKASARGDGSMRCSGRLIRTFCLIR